jgi:hypothetical protein
MADAESTTASPRGVVLLVGPDGAGKTTVLEALQEQLGRPVARAHSRPGLIAGREGDGAPVTDPHAQRPRGHLASLVKLAVVLIDTVLGSWIRWRRLGRDQLLIVERGWYDLAVDPQRYRLPRSFSPLVDVLGRLVPRADAVVVLTGEPAAFHARKPEIGVPEVERQLAAWRRYAPRAGRRVFEVDTVDQPPAASARRILAAISAPERRWHRVPLAPRRIDLRATGPGPAVAIYRPHRPAARLATSINGPLLRARLGRSVPLPPLPDIDAVLAGSPHPARQLAAFRSSAPDRWVVGVADHRDLHTVVKCRPDHDGLEREAAALRRLRSTERVVVPRLVAEHAEGGRRAVATAAVPTAGGAPDLGAVVDLAAALVRGDLGVPVVHGDLAPWNVAVDGDRIVVWDWEEAELDVVRPLHDLTHYLIRAGTLLGWFRPAEVAELLLAPDGPGDRHLAALGIARDSGAAHVRDYLARTAATTRHEQRFRGQVAAALPIVAEGLPSSR